MKRAAALALVILAHPTLVHSQPPAEIAACTSSGNPKTVRLRFPTGSIVNDIVWSTTIGQAVRTEVFRNVSQAPGCLRGGFEANGRPYRIYGENTDPAPRRIIPIGGGEPYLYLYPVSPPKGRDQYYVLAKVRGGRATAVRAYKGIPEDLALLREVAAAFSSQEAIAINDGSGIQIVVGSSKL